MNTVFSYIVQKRISQENEKAAPFSRSLWSVESRQVSRAWVLIGEADLSELHRTGTITCTVRSASSPAAVAARSAERRAYRSRYRQRPEVKEKMRAYRAARRAKSRAEARAEAS